MNDDASRAAGPDFKLGDLAREAGTSARTVRYYVQRGLLPAPTFRGKDSTYGSEHLVRLRAIRRLQDAFLPLDAIASLLAAKTLPEIERIADGRDAVTPPPESAAPPQAGTTPGITVTSVSDLPSSSVLRRFALAQGVELSIAEDAPPESRRLADRILRLPR